MPEPDAMLSFMPSEDAPRSKLPVFALLATLTGLAVGVVALLRPVTAPPVFDMESAMNAAGKYVPEQVESFYFFVPETAKPHEEEVSELAGLLAKAASERDYFGVAGPEPERNLTELLAALKQNQSKDLHGLILVYLGPEEHRPHVETAVAGSGASVKFVVYPAPPKNSI